MKRKIFCTFPQALIKEPLLFTLGNRFQVVPNIRGASVTEELAILSLELEGEQASIQGAIEYLIEAGVNVEDITDSDEPDLG
jgi:ABC-type methionine transport system ATPase subunit